MDKKSRKPRVKKEDVHVPPRASKRIQLGNQTFVGIRSYRKVPRVNIRDYVSDVHGDHHARKRGILLTLEQWNLLKENIDVIDSALKKRINNSA